LLSSGAKRPPEHGGWGHRLHSWGHRSALFWNLGTTHRRRTGQLHFQGAGDVKCRARMVAIRMLVVGPALVPSWPGNPVERRGIIGAVLRLERFIWSALGRTRNHNFCLAIPGPLAGFRPGQSLLSSGSSARLSGRYTWPRAAASSVRGARTRPAWGWGTADRAGRARPGGLCEPEELTGSPRRRGGRRGDTTAEGTLPAGSRTAPAGDSRA